MKHKRSQMKMIINIALIILGFIIILGLVYQFFSKAESKTAESICRGSIAARNEATFKTIGDMDIKLFPLLCKTLDVTVPEKPIEKGKEKELALKGIADYAARAWWMFGEGIIPDVFGTSWAGGPAEKDRCMIAYVVTIEGIDKTITSSEIIEFLSLTPYLIEEGTDGCMDFGGFCAEKEEECGEQKDWRFNDDNSICAEKYEDKTGCCHNKNTCFNKGGKCEYAGCGEGWKETDAAGWECPEKEICCIKEEKFFTYTDYIQKYNGEGNIGVQDGLVLKDNDVLAITYIAELAITVWPDNYFWEGEDKKINRILISSLDEVSDSCSLQEDIGGK